MNITLMSTKLLLCSLFIFLNKVFLYLNNPVWSFVKSHTDMAISQGDVETGWNQLAQSGSRSDAKVSSFPQVFIL